MVLRRLDARIRETATEVRDGTLYHYYDGSKALGSAMEYHMYGVQVSGVIFSEKGKKNFGCRRVGQARRTILKAHEIEPDCAVVIFERLQPNKPPTVWEDVRDWFRKKWFDP